MSCPQVLCCADRRRASVIVAVPARDEQALLGRCLDAVAAVAAGLSTAGPASDRAWIAMTDADSIVPVDWLAAHLHAANIGFDALVGAIAVDHWCDRQRAVDAGLSRHRDTQRRAGIRPVHGANLGVSAAALAAVGGVPAQAVSEDAALVRRLDAAGRAVLYDRDVVVRTSARRSARAPGGFSTLLDDLEELEPVGA